MRKVFAALLCWLFTATVAVAAIPPIPPTPFTFPLLFNTTIEAVPSGLGWTPTECSAPLIVGQYDGVSPWAGVLCPGDTTPETSATFFNKFSTALSAPGTTLYVNAVGGSDGNNCTAVGTPCLTIWGAQAKANTAALPATIFIAKGIYPRSSNFTAGVSTNLPTVDTAYLFTGGRSRVGTFDLFSAPSAGITYPNTYEWGITTVDRIEDIINLNTFGNYTDYQNVATGLQVNNLPGSWATVALSTTLTSVTTAATATTSIAHNLATGEQVSIAGASLANYNGVFTVTVVDGTHFTYTCSSTCGATPTGTITTNILYVRRIDNLAVTNTNTDLLRSGSNLARQGGAELNLYYGGSTAGDGGDLEGSGSNGAFQMVSSTFTPGVDKAIVFSGMSFKYAGGIVSTGARDVAIDSLNGVAACFNCRFDAAETDGWNIHVAQQPTAVQYDLLVNSTGYDNGRLQQSSNCITSHETSIDLWVGVVCDHSHGGEAYSIGSAKAFLAFDVLNADQGDLSASGGLIQPTAVRADNTATYWVDYVVCHMPGAGYCLYTGTNTATINYRHMAPFRQPAAGAGTIVPY